VALERRARHEARGRVPEFGHERSELRVSTETEEVEMSPKRAGALVEHPALFTADVRLEASGGSRTPRAIPARLAPALAA
jgi:hypothetical protein